MVDEKDGTMAVKMVHSKVDKRVALMADSKEHYLVGQMVDEKVGLMVVLLE